MFARSHRLRRSQDIQRVVTHGKRAQTPHARVYWQTTTVNRPYRVTIIVGKKVSKSAVVRNRLKRRVRAALKELTLPTGLDLVVLPRLDLLEITFPDLVKEMTSFEQHFSAK